MVFNVTFNKISVISWRLKTVKSGGNTCFSKKNQTILNGYFPVPRE